VNKINVEKITSIKDKLNTQITGPALIEDTDSNIEIKKSYSPPKINQVLVSTITTSGSSPSDFDAFNTSS
jgi:hypothetical protein